MEDKECQDRPRPLPLHTLKQSLEQERTLISDRKESTVTEKGFRDSALPTLLFLMLLSREGHRKRLWTR